MRAPWLLLVLLGCRPEPPVTPYREAPAPTAASIPVPEPVAEAPPGSAPPVPPVGGAPWQVGKSSWYGDALKGHKTASGERFDPSKMTAAHKTLPIGTWVEVRRPETGFSVRVRINDRGPFGPPDWIIDVSRAAADALHMVTSGVVRVELRIVSGP